MPALEKQPFWQTEILHSTANVSHTDLRNTEKQQKEFFAQGSEKSISLIAQVGDILIP